MTAPGGASALLADLRGGGWIAPGLRVGPVGALDAELRPIDGLAAAGLDWLTPLVQPMQDVLDRLAGRSSVIESFADAWQQAATTVGQVGDRLSRSAQAGTATWQGGSADAYRGRADEIAAAAQGSAAIAAATGEVARMMGQVVGGAREAVAELVGHLVKNLASAVPQAVAVEGGVTANVMSYAADMVRSYQPPIADIERKLQETIRNVAPRLTGGGSGEPGTTRGGAPSTEGRLVLSAAGGRRRTGGGGRTPQQQPGGTPPSGESGESWWQYLKRKWAGGGKSGGDTSKQGVDRTQLTPKQQEHLGYDREVSVAKIEGGRAASPGPGQPGMKIKTKYGSSDVDVIGKDGSYIVVGGPSKADDLGYLGSRMKILKEAADEAGVGAKAYFEEGTPQAAIDLAKKWLGPDNVHTFPQVPIR